MRTRRQGLAAACALLLLVAAPAAGEEASFDRAWEALARDTVAELEDLAAALHEGKVFAERNAVCEAILELAPDHARARSRLRYRKVAAGWVRTRYKPPRNLAPLGAEQRAARAALGDRFAAAALDLLAEHEATLPAPRRRALLRLVARVAPGRRDVRALLGEVETAEGRWLLAESVAAPARRQALAQAARRALDAAATPAAARPSADENRLRLGWAAILETPRARVLGTVPEAELRQAVRRAEASHEVFRVALGRIPATAKQLTFYVLAGVQDRATVLQHHPAVTDAYRTWAEKRTSSWFPKTREVWIAHRDAALRLEWCSRQVMAYLLSRGFGLRASPGWAFEGFGLYLSHLVAGQRRTFFVRRTQYEGTGTRKGDLWERLRATDADWRREARALLASAAAPDLRLLLGKELNAMDTEDMLASYALAAYLLEGRPDETPALLRALGKTKGASVNVLTAAGLDPATLALRLRRWLQETGQP